MQAADHFLVTEPVAPMKQFLPSVNGLPKDLSRRTEDKAQMGHLIIYVDHGIRRIEYRFFFLNPLGF